ncbi:MAG: hypothetical protein ACREIF_15490 [Chthoniobacterales bacterium]
MSKVIIVALTAALASYAAADHVKLSAIIAHPQEFDGRKVTVIGLAADNGNDLYVFPTFEAASEGRTNTRGAVYVPGPFKRDYNRHWVEVIGVVHASKHGWAGQNPCEIEMIQFRDLRHEKRLLWPEDIGLFFNATSSPVIVDSEIRSGAGSGTLINPHQTGTALIIPSGQLVVYRGADMKVIFTAKLQYPKRRPEHPSERSFRFVVHKHSLELAGEKEPR